jgi:deazaflavin-dependent oxidoreductase (nitroreductase family)
MRKVVLRTISTLNTWVYRITGGKWLGHFPSGAPVCLVTTKGRKSGQRRTVPLLFLEDDNDLIVVASQGGRPQHPAWYLNLADDPGAEVQIGSHSFAVKARTVSLTEKAALWPRLVALYPPYEEYQRRTARQIPVVRLSRA